MAYKYPNVFPTVAAIAPAIDFQKRIEEGVAVASAELARLLHGDPAVRLRSAALNAPGIEFGFAGLP